MIAPFDSPNGEGAPPTVSVIVPVFRDWDRVPSLLAALSAQEWRDFEVILVDNAPVPEAPALLLGHGLPALRVVHGPGPGSYAARNKGGLAARGAWLAFTDADCQPGPKWLSSMMAARGEGQCLLAGPVRVRPSPVPSPWEIYDAVRGIPQERYISRGYAATANLWVPAAEFHRLGGFDPGRLSGGDAEFCRRAGKKGIPLILVSEAWVDHPARITLGEIARKAKRVKGGQVASGTVGRRVLWTIRSVLPPVRDLAAAARAPYPWRWRATAAGVRFLLWGVEVWEVGRLTLLRRPPERR